MPEDLPDDKPIPSEFSIDRLHRGENREVVTLLEELEDNMLGRALYVEILDQNFTPLESETLGVENQVNKRRVRVGHALPLNKEGISHVIIALDGTLAVINTSKTMPFKKWYDRYFGTHGEEVLRNGEIPIHLFEYLKSFSLVGTIDEIIDGRRPENVAQVKAAFQDALEIAKEERQQVEAAKLQNRNAVLGGLKDLFNTDK